MTEDYSHLLGIIRQEHEFVVPGEKRLKLKKGGRAWRRRERENKRKLDDRIERSLSRKRTQNRYYRKNKEKLNRERAIRNAEPEYVYYKAMDRAKRANLEWEFDFDTWTAMWLEAPNVRNDASGFYVTAWAMKGSDVSRCTQMHRKNLSGPWSPENCHILYKGYPIEPEKERFENDHIEDT